MSNQEWSLGICRFNCTLLWRLPMQNHSKSSMTKKRWIKTACPIWYSIRLVFVKINIPDIRYNCKKTCSWTRRPKIVLEIRKKVTFSRSEQEVHFYKLFKIFTSHRKKTNRVEEKFSQTHIEEFGYYVQKLKLTALQSHHLDTIRSRHFWRTTVGYGLFNYFRSYQNIMQFQFSSRRQSR